jgi:hypothetical protein
MVTCHCCEEREAGYIIFDTIHRTWVYNCAKCIVPRTDIVVPDHMIEQLRSASCIVCGRKAEYIVYDIKKDFWCHCCAKHVDSKRDLVVPQHMIDQL